MAYQSIFSSGNTPNRQLAGKTNPYANDFVPGQYAKVNAQIAAQKAAVGPTQKWNRLAQSGANQKAKADFFSKVGGVLGAIGQGLTTSEQTTAKGIARILPGGSNDIKAQKQQATSANKNVQQVLKLQKTGKINPQTAQKLISSNKVSSNQAVSGQAQTLKEMPTKGQLAAGIAGTGADILTAGALPGVKAATTTGKVLKGATTATAYATDSALNAAAGGGTKKQIAENAVAGALFPASLTGVAKGTSKLVEATKVVAGKDQAVNNLIKNTATNKLLKTSDASKVGSKGSVTSQKASATSTLEGRAESAQQSRNSNLSQKSNNVKSNESGAIAPGQAVHDVNDLIQKHQATTKYSGDIQRGGDMVEGAKKQIQSDAVKVAKQTPKISTADKQLIQDYRDAKEAGLPTKSLPSHLQKVNDDITALNKAALDAQKQTAKLQGKELTTNINPATYTHRVAQGKGGVFDRLLQGAQNRIGGSSRSFAKTVPSSKGRVFQNITDSKGNRITVAVKNESFGKVKHLTNVQTGKKIGKFIYDSKSNTLTNAKGDTYKLGQATTSEITRASGQKYYIDPHLTSLKNYVESRTALENVKFIDSIKNHPDFEKFASAPDQNAPKNWEPVHGLMQFPGYKFEPKTAEALRDLIKSSGSDEVKLGDKLGNFLKKTIVYFPLKHNLNQTATYAVDRGLSALVNPMAYKRGAVSLVKAFHEVTNQGPIFQKLQKAGFSLPSVDDQAFSKYVTGELKSLNSSHPLVTDAAKKFGTTPLKVYNALQHTAVWQYGDILNVARVIERMQPTIFKKGMSLEDAMKATEKYSLQYKVPSRVGGKLAPGKLGRSLSATLQSPKVFFGRYKYDLYKIMVNSIKDTINLKTLVTHPGQNLQAADKLAAMAVGAAVVWPLVDKGVQKLSGNKNAYIKAPGALELPETINQLRTGKKNPVTVAGNQLFISSAVQIPLDVRNNRDSFTGKQIIDPNASGKDQLKQLGSWLLKQTPPAQKASQLANAKGNKAVDTLLGMASANFPKNSPEVNKLNSLQYDSLPNIQKQAKAQAQGGDVNGAEQTISQYNQAVLKAAKDALKAAGMQVPDDQTLINSLTKSQTYYAPKQSTIDSWAGKTDTTTGYGVFSQKQATTSTKKTYGALTPKTATKKTPNAKQALGL